MKTKIKFPLRVVVETDFDFDQMIGFEPPESYHIEDANGEEVCSYFKDQETAQLFADCFEEIAGGGHTDPDPCLCRTDYVIYDISRDLAKRAAEAVEEG